MDLRGNNMSKLNNLLINIQTKKVTTSICYVLKEVKDTFILALWNEDFNCINKLGTITYKENEIIKCDGMLNFLTNDELLTLIEFVSLSDDDKERYLKLFS